MSVEDTASVYLQFGRWSSRSARPDAPPTASGVAVSVALAA
jgi:hypothetical protein